MTAAASAPRPSLRRRLWATVEELGGGTAVLYWLHRAFLRLRLPLSLKRYLFVLQPVPAAPLLKPHRGRAIVVRPVAAGEPCLLDLPLTQAVLDFRFGQGAICFGAFIDDRIVGCLWLVLGPYDEDDVRCRFVRRPAALASWDFDVWVHPDHRSGFTFGRLWDTANAFLRERGVAWSASRISAFNVASLRSHAALGARVVGSATYLSAGRLQLMLSGFRPFLDLSLRRRPALVIPVPDAPQA
ncbi:hypothetical protein [Caenispirillum bisanense]|uniref:GNAT family N-acetyltransferase n=1 Tax=Caenispirillum bisanense TaxID=414052 RepID=UPI0031D8E4C3